MVLKKWGDIGLVGKKPVSIVLAKYRREEYVATNQWACHLAGLSVAAERNNKSWVLALDLYTLTHAQFTWCNRIAATVRAAPFASQGDWKRLKQMVRWNAEGMSVAAVATWLLQHW